MMAKILSEKFAREESARIAEQTGWDPRPYEAADRSEGWCASATCGDLGVHFSRYDGTYFLSGPVKYLPPHGARFNTAKAALVALKLTMQNESNAARDLLSIIERREPSYQERVRITWFGAQPGEVLFQAEYPAGSEYAARLWNALEAELKPGETLDSTVV